MLTSQNVQDLPINGRDYTKLIFLNPGVAGSPDQITDSPGSFGEFCGKITGNAERIVRRSELDAVSDREFAIDLAG